MIVVGLDLSLTHTGYAIISKGEKEGSDLLLASGVIKSKPSGPTALAETKRIVKIAEEAVQKIDEFCLKEDPKLVVIEGLAFMARNTTALVQLAGLNYLTRILLSQFEWPFMIVAPSTLKKFITGKGNSDKNIMMMEIYKQYDHTFLDDNVADAFALAAVGLATLGSPLKKVTVPQQEVINLLKTQI